MFFFVAVVTFFSLRAYRATVKLFAPTPPPVTNARGEYRENGLMVIVPYIVRTPDGYLTGDVVNETRQDRGFVMIQVNIYDASGAQVGTAFDSVNNLKAGGTWRFRAVPTTPDYSYAADPRLTSF